MKKVSMVFRLMLVVLLAVGTFAVSTGVVPGEAKSHPIVTIASYAAPFGTPNYMHSNALESISAKHHPWLRIKATETPGFVWNVQQMSKHPELWDKVIFQSGMSMVWMAENGMPPFKKKFTGIKALGNWAYGGMALTTFNPDIKSIGDLVGKKVGLGLMSQNNYGYFPRMIIEKGWGLKGKVKMSMVGTKAANDSLIDGLVDVSINYIAPPLKPGGKALLPAGLKKLFSVGRPVYFVDMGKEQIEKLAKKTGCPLFPITLPAGSVEGLKKDVVIMGVDVGHYAMSNMRDEIAYEFAKFYWENIQRLPEYYAAGKWSTQGLTTKATPKEMYHPGAIKFYEEVGAVWEK